MREFRFQSGHASVTRDVDGASRLSRYRVAGRLPAHVQIADAV
jgi:hypothetical protein